MTVCWKVRPPRRADTIYALVVAIYAAVSVIACPRPLLAQSAMTVLSQADAADSVGRYDEAERLWRKAFGLAGGDPIPLYLAGRSAARAGNRDTAFALLRQAIDDGVVIPFSVNADTMLSALHNDSRWSGLVAHDRKMRSLRDTALRSELLGLVVKDQTNRATIGATMSKYGNHSPQSDSALAAMAAGDAPLQARLRSIVDAHGWPGRRLVGDDGAHAAWVLLQHADSSYQAAMLPILKAAVRKGEARAGDAALLEDRVRVSAGLPQRYGTQLAYPAKPGGKPTLRPIENEACVDRRRAAVHLGPLADYLAAFGVRYVKAAGRCAAPSQAPPSAIERRSRETSVGERSSGLRTGVDSYVDPRSVATRQFLFPSLRAREFPRCA